MARLNTIPLPYLGCAGDERGACVPVGHQRLLDLPEAAAAAGERQEERQVLRRLEIKWAAPISDKEK